jgi:hypothetical protein
MNIFLKKKLLCKYTTPELDPDPDLAVKILDPAKRAGSPHCFQTNTHIGRVVGQTGFGSGPESFSCQDPNMKYVRYFFN